MPNSFDTFISALIHLNIKNAKNTAIKTKVKIIKNICCPEKIFHAAPSLCTNTKLIKPGKKSALPLSDKFASITYLVTKSKIKTTIVKTIASMTADKYFLFFNL